MERFTSDIEIPTQESEFIYESFLVIVLNITTAEFQGQTLNIIEGAKDKVVNVTSDTEWRVVLNAGPNDMTDDSVAMIHVPKQLLDECFTANLTTQRLAYFAFKTDALFSSVRQKSKIESFIIAARLNCSINQLSVPVSVTLTDTSNCVS